MPDYFITSGTKDHFQAQLLRDHPEIVSISPQLKLDEMGLPTAEGIIVVGVARRNPLRARGPGESLPSHSPRIPSTLPAIDAHGRRIEGQEVPVIVEDTGEFVDQMNTTRNRPCPGGFSIGHTLVSAGTIGGNARLGANFGYILSNNHILAANNAGAIGDEIIQPGISDGGTAPMDTIARLTRWVPIDFTGGNNEVDCAIAKAVNPADVQRNVHSIGTPAAIADGKVMQSVRKSGSNTQLTTGTIISDNATVRANGAVFVNQLQYTQMTASGDSGSLIWDQNSLTVVGLHKGSDGTYSYGNKILRVMELLSLARTIYDINGKPTRFQKEDISLLDLPHPQLGHHKKAPNRRRTRS